METEVIAVIISGALLPFIGQLVKRGTEISGLSAYVVTAVLAVAAGLVVTLVTGRFEWDNLAGSTGIVFAVSQTIFRFFLSRDRVVENVPLAD